MVPETKKKKKKQGHGKKRKVAFEKGLSVRITREQASW